MNCSNMYREGCEEVYWQMSLLKSNYWETIGIVMRALPSTCRLLTLIIPTTIIKVGYFSLAIWQNDSKWHKLLILKYLLLYNQTK